MCIREMKTLSLSAKPANPCFSSGPAAKHPGWQLSGLSHFLKGRSHRCNVAASQIEDVVETMRAVLRIPESYKVALLPGSTTGAMSAALWNFLGLRGVDVWIYDLFSARWAEDIQDQLRLADVRCFDAPFGEVPNFSHADFDRDQVFVWCGTTSGVWLQNLQWIANQRSGLTICDATSAVLCADLPWDDFDVTAFSWQKGFGSEAGVGVLVLSPRAMEHLVDYNPSWPIPRTLSLKLKGRVRTSLFEDSVPLNTISMLSVADMVSSLSWVQENGGLSGMLARVNQSMDVLTQWVAQTHFVDFLVKDPKYRSHSSVCLEIQDPEFQKYSVTEQWALLRKMAVYLESEKCAFDCLGHPLSPPCLRFWCGPTVTSSDLALALPWVDYAFTSLMQEKSLTDSSSVLDFVSKSQYK